MVKRFKENSLYIAWGIALAALLGSLYFSNIRGFPPCVLCWYQRILMYPLVIIIGEVIVLRDRKGPFYILPLSILGMILAGYHFLLYQGIIPEKLAPCTFGVSCTTVQIQWLGFINIPFMSFVAFAAITVLMFIYLKHLKEFYDQRN